MTKSRHLSSNHLQPRDDGVLGERLEPELGTPGRQGFDDPADVVADEAAGILAQHQIGGVLVEVVLLQVLERVAAGRVQTWSRRHLRWERALGQWRRGRVDQQHPVVVHCFAT